MYQHSLASPPPSAQNSLASLASVDLPKMMGNVAHLGADLNDVSSVPIGPMLRKALGLSAAEGMHAQHICSEQFRKHLYLNMAAPQTFARTFTKPGSRLY